MAGLHQTPVVINVKNLVGFPWDRNADLMCRNVCFYSLNYSQFLVNFRWIVISNSNVICMICVNPMNKTKNGNVFFSSQHKLYFTDMWWLIVLLLFILFTQTICIIYIVHHTSINSMYCFTFTIQFRTLRFTLQLHCL